MGKVEELVRGCTPIRDPWHLNRVWARCTVRPVSTAFTADRRSKRGAR